MLDNLWTPSHLAVIFGIAVLFFGGRKIAELGRGIGEGLRSFREGIRGVIEEDQANKRAA